MIKEENNNNFNWVYYVLGFLAGLSSAAVISGSFLWSLFGGILGLIMAGYFVGKATEVRQH